MSKVQIDWVMIINDEIYYGVKDVRPEEEIMTLKELEYEVIYLKENSDLLNGFNEYLFIDVLYLKDGVYQWSGDEFKKIADTFDSISPIKPIRINYDRVIC